MLFSLHWWILLHLSTCFLSLLSYYKNEVMDKMEKWGNFMPEKFCLKYFEFCEENTLFLIWRSKYVNTFLNNSILVRSLRANSIFDKLRHTYSKICYSYQQTLVRRPIEASGNGKEQSIDQRADSVCVSPSRYIVCWPNPPIHLLPLMLLKL